jgi:hypothetical protein
MNKAHIYSYSIFVQQMHWLEDKRLNQTENTVYSTTENRISRKFHISLFLLYLHGIDSSNRPDSVIVRVLVLSAVDRWLETIRLEFTASPLSTQY